MARLLIALSLLLAAAVALAQDEASPSEAREDEALAAESRGEYKKALEGFKQAFSQAVEEAAGRQDSARRAHDLARAEFYLEKIAHLTGKTTRYRSTGEFLSGFGTEAVGPSLKAWIDWRRARSLVAEGKLEEARKLLGDLGFITDFWLAGSFDNERGGGMVQQYPPESGAVDLDAGMRGKVREVRWRRVAFTPIFGYVDLDASLRPNDQALAYALAYVKSPADREAALRLASDEAAKAWVNGVRVLDRDVERPCGFDQDVVGVRLRKGWNRLLLKIGDKTGPWGFRVRFTDLDGMPLTDLTVGNTREEAAAAEKAIAAGGPVEPEHVTPHDGAREVLEAAVGEDRAGARDLFHLGYLHLKRQWEDRNLRRAQRLLEKAFELEPKNPHIAFALAQAAERKVQMSVEKEENERRQLLEETTDLAPEHALAHYLLAHYYTYSLPLFEKAEANLKRALEVNPLFLDARLLEIDLLRKRGFTVESRVKLMELVKESELSDMNPFLVRKAALQAGDHQPEKARETIARARAADLLDPAPRDRMARLLTEAEDPEGVIALLDERIRLNPYDVGARSRKAILLEGLGRFEEAAQVALGALEVSPENDDVMSQVGRLYHKIGNEEKAIQVWKDALAVNPKLAQLRRYVEFVDPSSRPFEDLFPVDLDPLLARAKGFVSEENDPWLNVLDQQIDKVNPDGTTSTFHRMLVKILNEQGVRSFDRYGVRSRGQSVHWKVARVIKPDGSTVEGKIQRGSADLPPLTPGDIVHLEYRLDELRRGFFGDYYDQWFYFADWRPTLRSEFVVIAPEGKELYMRTRNLDLEPEVREAPELKAKIYTFRVEDSPRVPWEPAMPSAREVFPQVMVSSYQAWDDFAKWYWNLIRNQFQLNDEMKAKVASLTEGKESRYDKIRAVYDFVTTDIRYDASWEFGVHGYKPYDATAIYARKFGDCKDKAILTATLLREIGVEAWPVLIHAAGREARWDEDLTLPMVGHFNHAIAYVPDADGKGRGMFLDGTAQYHSIEAMPGMDRGARVLVIRPDGGELLTVPWNKPELNNFDQNYDVEFRPDGSAVVKAELEFGGDTAVGIRSFLAVEGQRELRLNSLVGRLFGKATLDSFTVSDLTDLSVTNVSVGADVSVPRLVEKSPRGFELKVSFMPVGGFSNLAAQKERKWDIVLGPPSTQSSTVVYHLPEGFEIVKLPEPVEIETGFGRFAASCTAEGGTVTFISRLTLSANRVPVDQYEDFRNFGQAIDVAMKERIVVTGK